MRYLFLPLVILMASSSSSCLLNANAASKVAAGRTHVPIEGNVASVSASDLAAAVRTLGTWPVYRLEVVDHNHVTAYQRPDDYFCMTPIDRVDGKWQSQGTVIITP